jgi:hypothetical protein
MTKEANQEQIVTLRVMPRNSFSGVNPKVGSDWRQRKYGDESPNSIFKYLMRRKTFFLKKRHINL